MYYAISWSGGKDSTASIILAHKYGYRIDGIFFVETMFDLKNNISGENPQHMDFVLHVAKPLFESWGYPVYIIRGKKDFLSVFHHIIEKPTKHMEHRGMKHGFPLTGFCAIKRECKLKPMYEMLHRLEQRGEDIIQYIGYAADEPVRLRRLHKTSNISLLEKYGVTEEGAVQLCKEYGLYSPSYELSKRGGCWFCPFAKLNEHKSIKKQMPEEWKKYIALEAERNVAFSRWNAYSDLTLHQIDEMLEKELLNEK